jgi:hypothetical protein
MRIMCCKPRAVVVCALMMLATTGSARASVATPTENTDYYVNWYAMGSGGRSKAVSVTYQVSGLAGQSVVGLSTSTSYSVNAGFWFGTSSECADCIFFNGFEETGTP